MLRTCLAKVINIFACKLKSCVYRPNRYFLTLGVEVYAGFTDLVSG